MHDRIYIYTPETTCRSCGREVLIHCLNRDDLIRERSKKP